MDTSQLPLPNESAAAEQQLDLPEVPPQFPQLVSLAHYRSEKNLTPAFAASSLRLSVAQILALEQQNWDRLPGPAYIKGFLRSYCKLLQIDAQPYLDQYAQTLAMPPAPVPAPANAAPLAPAIEASAVSAVLGDPQLPLAHFDDANELNVQRKRTFLLALALIIATALFLLVWERALWLPPVQAQFAQWFAQAPAQALPAAVAPAAPAPIALDATAPAPAAPLAPAPAAPELAVAPSSQPVLPQEASASNVAVQLQNVAKTDYAKTVELQFLEPVWLELRDKSGVAVTTGMHKAGTTAKIKADAPLLLIVGASHAVNVKVEGKKLDLDPHTSSNVAKVKIP